MKISVIIAAYNAEKYLAESIYSAVNQSMNNEDYEIIVINDGSTDSTLSILQSYQKKYSNIKIINKENGGPSSARNLGLEQAKGEYIYFFDADDIMEKDSLEALYNRATKQNADLVIARYDLFNKAVKSYINNLDELVKLDTIDKYDARILWTFALWNKLFKKSVIDENNIKFPPFSNAEDGVFVMSYVFKTSKITGLDKIVLHYRKMFSGSGDSITTAVSKRSLNDYINAHDMIFDVILNSIKTDFPELNTLDKIRDNFNLNYYINDFYRKFVNLAIGQFYSKLLTVDDECANIIINSLKDKCNRMDPATIQLLQSKHPEVNLLTLGDTRESILSYNYITAVLYGEAENDTDFIRCLSSLIGQSLIGIKIVVPTSTKKQIINAGLMYQNITFIDADTESQLHKAALNNADTDLIIFCNRQFIYSQNVLKTANRRHIRWSYDFATCVVYSDKGICPAPISSSKAVIDTIPNGLIESNIEAYDNLLANKVFSVEFLKSINADISDSSFARTCYKKGYFEIIKNEMITFAGDEIDYINYINDNDAYQLYKGFGKSLIEQDISEIDNKKSINTNTEYYSQYSPVVEKEFDEKLKNQVCIICSKENAEAWCEELKDCIKAKVKIFSDDNDKKAAKTIASSKVIITDKMLSHLDSFPARSKQRFLLMLDSKELFESNGLDKYKNAYLNRYSGFCVCGKGTASIYSDELSIDSSKVYALGSPNTDALFSKSKKAEKIIKKNKALKDKEIILLSRGNRIIDEECIDFDQLSKSLKDNQVVVTTDNITGEYENIINMDKELINELMLISSMLITDYSPIILDYSLLQKPIIFFCPDLFANNAGMRMHYPEDVPSHLVSNQLELEELITNSPTTLDKQSSFSRACMAQCDGRATKRLADLINEYMEVK